MWNNLVNLHTSSIRIYLLRALNFEFYEFLRSLKVEIFQIEKNLQSLKMTKTAVTSLQMFKNWFHVKSEWQNNSAISTLWYCKYYQKILSVLPSVFSASPLCCRRLQTGFLPLLARKACAQATYVQAVSTKLIDVPVRQNNPSAYA